MRLKNKKLLRSVLIANVIFTFIIVFLITVFDLNWNVIDYKLNDLLYKWNLDSGNGPKLSKQVVYLNITDETYNKLEYYSLDRKFLGDVNKTLSDLGVNGIMYDLVFRLPSDPEKDAAFTESLIYADNIYLPAGLRLNPEKIGFKEKEGSNYYKILKERNLGFPKELNAGSPLYASEAVTQLNQFNEAAYSTGHITTIADQDGIYRHYPLIVKVDEGFLPTVSFEMFLDYVDVPIDSLIVEWGEAITIPKLKDSFVEKEIKIPIDESGMTFIPYPATWKDLRENSVEIHKLLEFYSEESNFDELLEKFEGNFVVIGDVAAGISDLGQTPLETDVPLVIIHATLLNSYLTNSFYSYLSTSTTLFWIILLAAVGGFLSILHTNKFLYIYSLFVVTALILFSYLLVGSKFFLPIGTIGMSYLASFASMVAFLQVFGSREQAYIRDAFSKYVPKSIVEELIQNPDTLKLGGEEKYISILFSDIKSFTSISEELEPKHLVSILNEYLTEMTQVILEQRGTVDKFIGDGIMAEFGAPLEYPNHEDAAVSAGLLMQFRLRQLNERLRKQGIPQFLTRIGINSGPVVIGNMGSNQVFDYTAMGDSINLASRLEGANKKYDSDLMISENTYKNLSKDKFRVRQLDYVCVKGKVQPVKIYEVYAFIDERIKDELKYYLEHYQKGLELFFGRQFGESRNEFESALKFKLNDAASLMFLNRIEKVSGKKLDDSWNGAVTFFDK
ncbi:MAG: adenylate/guanylate cyclase domain-containing protein [Melioribacteraceae bacterium]|nr:adenylate/guanylate cyclase domain-containing protein [Melioribacteraceae bacterium]